MMKVWDLDQLSEKFQRVTDAENVDFVVGPVCLFIPSLQVKV